MFKKVLSILLASVLMLGTISFTVFAEDTDIIEVGAGKTYTTWSAAVAAAADNNSDKAITYHIYGKVEVDKTGWVSPRGTSGATTINFVGMTDDAELCIPTATSTVIATDNVTDMVAINYTDLILSRTAGAWVGDLGNANNYFVCWMRGADNAVVNYTDCTFPNGSCNNQYGKTVYNNCDFRNETEYCLWMYGGFGNATVEVNGGTMIGKKGAKTHAEITTSPVVAEIEGVTFDIESKPAIVVSALGSVELNDVDATACEYGILENGSTQGTAAVTIDGETPEYVATYTDKYNVTVYVTDMGYAEVGVTEAVANGKTSEIAAPAAQIGAIPYASLESAIADAKENDTIKIASGTYDCFEISTDNITITGMDEDTVITVAGIDGLERPVGGTAFIGINADGVTIENIKFVIPETVEGNRTWLASVIGYSTDYHYGGIQSNGWDVINCDFVQEGDILDYAIFNTNEFTVSDCGFENFTYGITSMGDGSAMGTVAIENNEFTMVDYPVNVYWGQAGDNTDSLTITGNNFVSAKDEETVKLLIDDYATRNVAESGISNITIDNTYTADTEFVLVDSDNEAAITTDNDATVVNSFTSKEIAIANTEAGDVFYINYNTNIQTQAERTEDGIVYTEFATESGKEAFADGVYYETLAAAINAAESGDTVEVLTDITVDTWVSIWNTNGLTINGNNKTLTVNAVNSGINGGGLFLNAENLTINDLTVNLPESATERPRLATMKSGALNNVTVIGGTHGVSVLGDVTITDCEFEGQSDWAIETESAPAEASLTIADCTFEENAVILRGENNSFTGNTIENEGEGVNVLGNAVITNNDFGESTLGIDSGVEVVLEKNIINNVEFSNWLGGEDYSDVTVENNKLSDEALETLKATIGEDVESVDPSFEVDGETFFTLTDAIAAAEDGAAITLYADAEITAEDYANITEKELTLTLGDYTLTAEDELADTSFITVPSGYKVKSTSTDGVYVYSIAKKTSSKQPSGNSGSYYPSYDYDSDKYVPEAEDKKDLSDFPFTDVTSNFWGYDGIAYCWQNNIMNGMTSTTFEPETSLSRAMLVTMLYRLAGSPEVETTENEWYSAARVWAMNNTISDGTNMNDEITREQLATMLCRYAAKQGVDTGISADLTVFTDAESISDYAYTSVSWAVRSGLMNGMGDGTLSPDSGATRAQVAAIFMRAADIIEK